MSDARGVGVNGEPDDFAARYDRMLLSGGAGWVVRVVIAIAVVLAVAALVWRVLPL
jgi:hypothetical protein